MSLRTRPARPFCRLLALACAALVTGVALAGTAEPSQASAAASAPPPSQAANPATSLETSPATTPVTTPVTSPETTPVPVPLDVQAPPSTEPRVTTRLSTHVTRLDGHRVTLDVYSPVGAVRGAAVLSHGFTRSRRTLSGHAQALAEAGVLTVTPDLPCSFDFRCNARALAELVGLLRAGQILGPPVQGVLLAGFSAGGLSSLLAAHTPGVVGYVGLDPFDRRLQGDTEALGRAAAATLHTETLLLRAPPSRCNGQAAAAPWAGVLPALWRDELIADASHCDFESPTDWRCRLACGASDPGRQHQVRQHLLEAAARWLR